MLVLTVFSEAAKDGTPLNVENLLDVRFDVTYKFIVSRFELLSQSGMDGVATLLHRQEHMEGLTLGAMMGREESTERAITVTLAD